MPRPFRSSIVWRESHELAVEIYKVTKSFPKSEVYGLSGQLRRAAVSIPSNIAEGCGRESFPDLVRSLRIASGSASEVDYQTLLAGELGYFDRQTVSSIQEKAARIQKLISGLCKKHKSAKME